MRRPLCSLCQFLMLLVVASRSGRSQSPNPAQTSLGKDYQPSDFFYGRAVCEKYNEDMKTYGVVVCEHGYKSCFTTAFISKRGDVSIIAKGCWPSKSSEEGPCTRNVCLFGIRENVGDGTRRTCCCRGFSCNKNSTHIQRSLLTERPSTITLATFRNLSARENKAPRTNDIGPKETVILGVISSVFAMFLILSVVFVSWRCAVCKKNRLRSRHRGKSIEEMVECSTLSTDDISFWELIRKGNFSSVWNAEYDSRKVFIKIYKREYYSMWRNEIRTYDIIGSHPCIAKFLDGVELFGSKPGNAIILAHYPYGSLYNYLSTNSLTWQTMYNLVLSLASGVAYVHGEIDEYDYLRRKVIVHRNLNSSNVLVRSNGSCVLSNFETAVFIVGKQVLPMVEGGCIHYMPPEVLQGEVNWNDWESALKQADVYSFGLVLWEIVRKCTDFYDHKEELLVSVLPYQRELGNNPSAKQLIQHIVTERKRPMFPTLMGLSDKSDSLLRSTIEECWDTEPEARLTALCVVKRMQEVESIKNSTDALKQPSDVFWEVCPRSPTYLSNSNDKERHSPDEVSLDALPVAHYCFQFTTQHSSMEKAPLEKSLIPKDASDCMHSGTC